jgi:hypothetical protein
MSMDIGLSIEEVAAAISTMTNKGYDPNSMSVTIQRLIDKPVILRDNKKVFMSGELYDEYFNTYNPPEWDTYEEYLDKIMVLEL